MDGRGQKRCRGGGGGRGGGVREALLTNLFTHLLGGDQLFGVVVVEDHADGGVSDDEAEVVRLDSGVDGRDDEEHAAGVPAVETGGALSLFPCAAGLLEERSQPGSCVRSHVGVASTEFLAGQILKRGEVFGNVALVIADDGGDLRVGLALQMEFVGSDEAVALGLLHLGGADEADVLHRRPFGGGGVGKHGLLGLGSVVEGLGEEGLAELVDARGVVPVDRCGFGDDGSTAAFPLGQGGFEFAPQFAEDGMEVVGIGVIVEDRDGNLLAGLRGLGGDAEVEHVHLVPGEVAAVADAHAGAGREDGEAVEERALFVVPRDPPQFEDQFGGGCLVDDGRLVHAGFAALVDVLVDALEGILGVARHEVAEDAGEDEDVFAEGLP